MKRWSVRLFAVCLVMLACGAASAQQVRVRKNIDSLSDAELKAFAHAIQKLQDNKDPLANYLFWADIHGFRKNNRGPCEHNSELLWAWHRAYLLAFEDALRASDPPVTSNVTIPYWDWSRPPSGSRYPKAFETMNELMPSPSVCPTLPCRNTTPNANPPFDPITLRNIQALNNWPEYGGEPKATGGGKGQLEDQPHDFIHGIYIGGLNGTPRTAARDPLFWAHHAYMDYLWAQWQSAHPGPQFDPVCLTCAINFLPDKKVQDYLSISALGYSYQPSPPQAQPLAKAALPGMARMLGVPIPESPTAVEIAMNLPTPSSIKKVKLHFVGVTVPTDASYLVNIYLVAPGATAAQRHETIPLTFFAAWRMDEEHAGHAMTVNDTIDITSRLLPRLQSTDGPSKWMLEAEIVRSTDGKLQTVPFGKPFGWKDAQVIVESTGPEGK